MVWYLARVRGHKGFLAFSRWQWGAVGGEEGGGGDGGGEAVMEGVGRSGEVSMCGGGGMGRIWVRWFRLRSNQRAHQPELDLRLTELDVFSVTRLLRILCSPHNLLHHLGKANWSHIRNTLRVVIAFKPPSGLRNGVGSRINPKPEMKLSPEHEALIVRSSTGEHRLLDLPAALFSITRGYYSKAGATRVKCNQDLGYYRCSGFEGQKEWHGKQWLYSHSLRGGLGEYDVMDIWGWGMKWNVGDDWILIMGWRYDCVEVKGKEVLGL
ncbi:hypothetical protein Tco_1101694 [Tanacetum coccineum]